MKNLKSKAEIEKGIKHLKKADERLKTLIKHFGLPVYPRQTNYFKSLVRAIVYQQLHGKAAATILARFEALYKSNTFPTPKDVLKTTDAKLRKCGLSERKASYIKNIATSFEADNWSPQKISRMTNDEVHEKLTALKGIGSWTADIFIMFTLNRPDVLPLDDFGIRQGFMFLYNKKKQPSEKFMLKESKSWSPYRTLMSFYLWQLANEKQSFSYYK